MNILQRIALSSAITALLAVVIVIINGGLSDYVELSNYFFYIEELIKTISVIYISQSKKEVLLLCLINSLIFGVIESIFNEIMINCFIFFGILVHLITTNVMMGNLAVLIAYQLKTKYNSKFLILIPYLFLLVIPSIAHLSFNELGYTTITMCEIDNQIIAFIKVLFT